MTLQQIALNGITIGIKESEILEHWDYRKGKTFEDVKRAFEKGKKNGFQKTEYEIQMTATYLANVLKKKRNPRK